MDFEPIIGGLTALIVFIGLSTPIIVIGLIYYLKKRLEHKQILAAIEKGTPLSELKPPKPPKPAGPLWIRYLTTGIALIIIASGLFCWFYVRQVDLESGMILAPFIFLAIGIAWLIRGLLYRKYYLKTRPSADNNTAVKSQVK